MSRAAKTWLFWLLLAVLASLAWAGRAKAQPLPAPLSTAHGLTGITGTASAPCFVPNESGPVALNDALNTGPLGECVEWGTVALDHQSLFWSWTFTGAPIPPPRVGRVVEFRVTPAGPWVRWGGVCDLSIDGFVDGIDADLFSNWFEQGDARADWNGDGFVDGMDSDGFANAFEEGR